MNLNHELIQTLLLSDDLLLCVSFCSVGCYLAILCSFTKICFCSNLLITGMRFPFFISFVSLPQTVQGIVVFFFFTLPGKKLSEHSKNVFHCCFSPASFYSSHVTIMLLQADVAMFDLKIALFC